ncbi:NAD(P)/FAD-dependent oxidoreductase [Pseudomonas sp. 14P_8.1_Bac3]|uniref:flavin monoamine oxidase family protein n=1 Tax=Pseudomonas sp. 14P_8.1_Bac3 TaxID=2971621 RepID=UPI0021C5D82E|nr:NAD(P)/FAD-dependent oxidoreductase [Pseudomonas sp. 14P_8.1_Bac3]MCU1760481.1 NAD(P)/FAD-dependent oxidoreductase [Pseudomonas sp. 14P_8.1_Bac3]
MTIGSSYDYPSSIARDAVRTKRSADNKWVGRFPNPPDLCFDYRALVEQENGIAKATDLQHSICIIGAGVTGLTAARELYRCGFTQISLIEQARRIGGRHLTVPGSRHSTRSHTPFEMGAMRMPFFNRADESPTEGRSLMAHYAQTFDLAFSDFANPGSQWVSSTGIYLREGSLSGEPAPHMLIWKNADGLTPPPGEALQKVYARWKTFADRMTDHVAEVYASSQWEAMWAAIVKKYQRVSFRDLVSMAALDAWDERSPGDFGGMGMSTEESAIFYAIGIGDGSWGAFYDVCCLYPLRTAIFGFSSQLQLIHGRVDSNGDPLDSPYLNNEAVFDSAGLTFDPPRYIGLAALDECLMFMKTAETGKSVYEHSHERNTGLLTDASVTRLRKLSNQKIRVYFTWKHSQPEEARERFADFDSVIMTLPSWLIETRITLESFTAQMLPFETINAYKTAHWETSCKVFAPLKKSFLSKNTNIPQAIVTDSFIHDVYTYRYNDHYSYDCILLSYTWEDDATKLASFSDKELVTRCANELDRILMNATNIREKISPYIALEHAVVQRWITDKNALGCAKLYRPGTYYEAVGLMKYNRDFAHVSGLYFSGESFSVDAGWTEPCFRGAVDAVIHICSKTHATFNGGFSMNDYPHYQPNVRQT